MNVIPFLVGCSLFLAACGVALFVWSVCRGEHDHADRLSLLPLEDDLQDPEKP
jgi:cbb3-type cytochrome oxidase maturation protein